MEFKDYYATLGVAHDASPVDIKRAYRKLARRYHPDVSKAPNAEARFKEVAEAHEALIDPERRAAYDNVVQRHARGQPFEPPPGWDSGFEYSGAGPGRAPGRQRQPSAREEEAYSEFFESLFGHGGGGDGRTAAGGGGPLQGRDHHARIAVDLLDACRGSQRLVSLHTPVVDPSGRAALHERHLEVNIPKGVRDGQQLRLAGQGAAGHDGGPPGDLYLEIRLLPHPVFRLEGTDILFDLPVAPWEAALGAEVTAATPDGNVLLQVPSGSSQGRKLRLRGKGFPAQPPGDLYAVLTVALPPAATEAGRAAYRAMARSFEAFDPRAGSRS